MSVKSESIQSKKDSGQDERLKKISPLRVLLNRPELGALGGSILVFIFFGIVAGDTGMFSAYGTLNFLDKSHSSLDLPLPYTIAFLAIIIPHIKCFHCILTFDSLITV